MLTCTLFSCLVDQWLKGSYSDSLQRREKILPCLDTQLRQRDVSLSLFGHCHGNCGSRQIYFAPIRFLWVSMNTILGFLSSRLGLALSAYGQLKGNTSDSHTHTHTYTKKTHTQPGVEDATEILYTRTQIDHFKPKARVTNVPSWHMLVHTLTHFPPCTQMLPTERKSRLEN